MESVSFVGLRDATHSFGKKATADQRLSCLYCDISVTFERREFLPRWVTNPELLTLALERKKNLPV
tara:strand:- start:165 stop:362 length:198 start_codon:yes stop_codon:yes gene_type:complete